jgi:hypothetical protein
LATVGNPDHWKMFAMSKKKAQRLDIHEKTAWMLRSLLED